MLTTLTKLLTWCGNLALASLLVLLASQQYALAAENFEATGELIHEDGRILVPLTGTATVKSVGGLAVSPSSFDTDLVEIGQSVTRTVTLTHIGAVDADPVSILGAELFGKSASEYTADFAGYVTLQPGDTQAIQITFTPSVPGTKSAGLRMDIEGSTSPYVLLFNGWSRYPLTSDLAGDKDALTFGQAIVGATKQQNLVLSNLGEEGAPVINVNNFQLSGDTPDAFDVVFTPFQLQPGQSKTVVVKMSSNAPGFKSADVLIEHDGNNAAIEMTFEGTVIVDGNVPPEFGKSTLKNVTTKRATTLQFGPDGKLYLGQMDGSIKVINVTRNGKNNYTGNVVDTIYEIQKVQNHNDDGSVNNGLGARLLTGLLVTGTAANPIIYAASSDPRQAAGPSGTDSNLDTNSGILHKVTKGPNGWQRQDLVRGLPRSEENHVPNGLQMKDGKILLNIGGHTNMGAPSNNFALLPEYALSASIVEIDIAAIGNGTYDLPTLDDEDRPGVNDNNDPFGGNDGKNQAKLVANGPVKLYATGFRNHYDLVVTQAGKVYTFDNGPNPGWGGTPVGNCTNNRDDGGIFHQDNLHLVNKGTYGGHPNPTRGNKNNKFNTSNPQSPIEVAASPEECTHKMPGADGSMTSIGSSSNGITEYTATNFSGSMMGDLLVAAFNKNIYRIELNAAGNAVTSKSTLFTGVGTTPLDVTALGPNGPFPGTVWVADNIATAITVFEPADY